MNNEQQNNTASDFPPTRWSVVIAARQAPSPESAAALETLCRNYWYPLYGYARRCGKSPQDAEDITQGFFCQLLEKGWLEAADHEKGRLRTFLIVALKNYMRKEWRASCAQRRGGGRRHVPVDTRLAESRYAADPQAGQSAEKAYDRQWALTLLELTLDRLRSEFEIAGKDDHFDVLKGSLMAVRGTIDYNWIAERLGTTDGAARVAVHRLRKRFRNIYRQEIRQTLPDDADVEVEICYLAAALAHGENASEALVYR